MECVEHSIIVDCGEQVCERCGTIMCRVIDETAEWRNYEDNRGEDKSRTGGVTSDLLPESSYGSIVSLRGINNPEMKILQRLSSWSLSSNRERSWMGIFDAISMTCHYHTLPKAIVLEACALYKGMEDAQKVRGETRRALMGAAVYVACRNNDAGRTHEEIAKMFFVSIRSLCKAVPRFTMIDNTVLQTQLGIAERLCAGLHLNDEQRDRIIELLHTIASKSEDEFEHTPKTIVAGVTAHVMGLKTKAQMKVVSEVSGVSVLSIHKLVSKI
jgi:transcription initiation factor TFIIB